MFTGAIYFSAAFKGNCQGKVSNNGDVLCLVAKYLTP